MTYFENGIAIFDYELLSFNSIAITQWYDITGVIDIPTHINEELSVALLKKGSFVLTNETLRISIDESMTIEEGAFDTRGITVGFSPIINTRNGSIYVKASASESILKDVLVSEGWYFTYNDWGSGYLVLRNNVATYESSKDGMKFIYRKINDIEIEIIKWVHPTTYITIPTTICGNLSIVSIAEGAFGRHLLDIEKIIVPKSIKTICKQAFYVETLENADYFDSFYHSWYIDAHKAFCEIYIPSDVCIENITAVLRGTEERDKFGSYERTRYDSVVITLIDSPTYKYFVDNDWEVVKQSDKLAMFVDRSCFYSACSKFKNYDIEYPECWR